MASTQYILAGGNDRANADYWVQLSKAIKRDKPLHILSCMFARPEEIWQETFEGYIEFFKVAFGSDMKPELASPKILEEQVKHADVIYLHGGDTDALRKYLAPFDTEKMFEDKIVIGSSAGAQILSQLHWTPTGRYVRQGLGIVPLNVMVHYGSDYGSEDPRGPIDWSQAEKELQEAVGNAKVTHLPEGRFVVHTS